MPNDEVSLHSKGLGFRGYVSGGIGCYSLSKCFADFTDAKDDIDNAQTLLKYRRFVGSTVEDESISP